MKNYFLLIISIICFESCSKSFKRKVGFETSGPDEYSVRKYPALKVPKEFSLPQVEEEIDTHSKK